MYINNKFLARKLVDNVGIIQIDPGQDVNIQDFSELLAKLVLRQSVPFFDVDLSVHPSDGNSSYILQVKTDFQLKS